jgi:hypothetical protein
MTIKLRPFFTYYGGKYRLAPKYPKPKYCTIIEPFAGSAGYSLRYYYNEVILNDINPIIFGIWDYLIRVSEDEFNRLPLEFDNISQLKICQEAKWFIGFWLNKAHIQPCIRPSTWMKSKTRPNSYWGENVRMYLGKQLQYIRHWKIKNEHYEYLSNIEATWFVDPPYDSKAGKLYPYSDINYSDLAYHCKNWRGQVIACEQDGANWLPFRYFQKTLANPGSKGKGYSKEAIWTNISLFD